jgi:hypothetical protein
MSLLAPLVELFRYSLQPIAPFTWLGWGISTLDVVATVRLCIALRQIREIMFKQHVSTRATGQVEAASFVKKSATTLLVVYGGEAVICTLSLDFCIFHVYSPQLTCMVIDSPFTRRTPFFHDLWRGSWALHGYPSSRGIFALRSSAFC